MFNLTPLAQGFALEMDSRLENVDRCVERIRLFLKERGAESHLFSLSLLAREAVEARHYEAGAALFDPGTGDLFVETSRKLIAQLADPKDLYCLLRPATPVDGVLPIEVA